MKYICPDCNTPVDVSSAEEARSSCPNCGPQRASRTTEQAREGDHSTLSIKAESIADTCDWQPPAPAPGESASPGRLPERIDRYTVRRQLGAGGFGLVYLAHDDQLQRQVAIKTPRAERFSSPAEVERFLGEARAAAKLDHSGIVTIYDVGQTPDGNGFIVMEYVEGSSLAGRTKTGRLPYEETARIMIAVADAVHYGHKRGLVHRDLKPANILLDPTGRPRVADFGLAIDEQIQQLRAGEVAGTPRYMAPEQVRGEAHRLDGRTDVWSLGVVLYELLTGRCPFTGDTGTLFDEILHREPKPLRQIDDTIPKKLEEICLKCLAKPLTDRYSTAADLARDLRHWRKPPWWLSKKVLVVGVLGLVLLAAVVGTIVGLKRMPEPSPIRPPSSADMQRLREDVLAEVRQVLAEQNRRRLNRRAGLPAEAPATPALQAVPALEGPPKDPITLSLPRDFQELERQIRAASEEGDEEEEFSLLLRATNELVADAHFSIAEVVGWRMVQLAGNDPGRVPFAYGQLGLAQYRGGRAEEAITNLYKSIEVYRTLYEQMQRIPETEQTREYLSHLARMIGITLMRIGNANKFLGRQQRAQEAYEEAKQLYELHERRSELTTLLLNYGGFQSNRGNHQEAIAMLEQGVELARKLDDVEAECELRVNLANAYSRAGDNDEALPHFEAAYELLPPDASYELRSALLANWSTALVEEGDLDAARARLNELREVARPEDEESQRVLALLPAIVSETAANQPDEPDEPES